MKRLFIKGQRSGYTPEQCGATITVGELIGYLNMYDAETEVYISNDNGYTFGEINEWDSFTDDEEGRFY